MASPKDHLGSVKVIVNTSGNRVAHTDLYPFGFEMPGRVQCQSGPDCRYKFTGKERDSETSYDYFGARYYDARIGRWLQVDPLGEKYPSLNPYHYVANNPINRFDPDGKFDWKKIFGISDQQQNISNNYSTADVRTSLDNVNAFYNELNNEINEKIVKPVNETLAPVSEAIDQVTEVAQEATILATKNIAPVLDETGSGLAYVAPFTGPFAPKVATTALAIKGTATGLKIINKAVGGNDFTWKDITGDAMGILLSRVVPGGQGLYGTIAGDVADKIIENSNEKEKMKKP